MYLFAGFITVQNIKSILHESILMKDFDHPNVLNVLGVGFNTDNGLPFVVLPFMVNGDLKTYLKKKRQKDVAVEQLPGVCSILWLYETLVVFVATCNYLYTYYVLCYFIGNQAKCIV